MLPILEREMVDIRGWHTQSEILDLYALAQCLPGLIMTNTLAFIGHKQSGIKGAIFGAIGTITPALFIITTIAALLTTFADEPIVANAFAGIRVCVCVLIFNAVLSLFRAAISDIIAFIIFILVVISSITLNISPIIFVIYASLTGLIITVIRAKIRRRSQEYSSEDEEENE